MRVAKRAVRVWCQRTIARARDNAYGQYIIFYVGIVSRQIDNNGTAFIGIVGIVSR